MRKYQNAILQYLLIRKCSLLVNNKYKTCRQSETKNPNIALNGNLTRDYNEESVFFNLLTVS